MKTGPDRPVFQGVFTSDSMEEKLGEWEDSNDGHEAPDALSIKFDQWGNVVEEAECKMTWSLWDDKAELQATRQYEFDALARRIAEGDVQLYWSMSGQVIEDRVGSGTTRYVWGPGGLVLRDADSDGSRSTTYDSRLPAGVEERVYAITDASGSVSAITDWAGNVLERYLYTPEGKLEIRTGDMSTVLTSSAYGWGYTYQSGRRDGEHLYYVGGQGVRLPDGEPGSAGPGVVLGHSE
jgi:hypothetical protein